MTSRSEPWTGKTDAPALTEAIKRFERDLPGWWFTVSACSVSRDASCGPDRQGPDAHLLKRKSRVFDDGFHADLLEGTLAEALDNVREQALAMKSAANREAETS